MGWGFSSAGVQCDCRKGQPIVGGDFGSASVGHFHPSIGTFSDGLRHSIKKGRKAPCSWRPAF
eukprot:9286526-Prorocentrum_lima.AAC.1